MSTTALAPAQGQQFEAEIAQFGARLAATCRQIEATHRLAALNALGEICREAGNIASRSPLNLTMVDAAEKAFGVVKALDDASKTMANEASTISSTCRADVIAVLRAASRSAQRILRGE